MPAIARAHSVTDIMSGSTNRAGATVTISPVISGLLLKASPAHKYCGDVYDAVNPIILYDHWECSMRISSCI